MSIRCQTEYEICSHIYDPEKGDPENGIQPGTLLEKISDDWICPRCRVARAMDQKKEGGKKDG